jgi:phage terminase large subunit-like protein
MGEGTLGHLGWLEDVDQGRVVACRKIRLVARRMLGDLEHPGRWHYDAESAANHVDFIESFCCHPSGDLEPLVLEPFQRAIIACVFGFVDDDGRRRYQEVLVVMARKNGKSTLASAIELDMLLNPTEGEWAPSIYNVATAKDQANLCFDSCLTMLSSSPVLRRTRGSGHGTSSARRTAGPSRPWLRTPTRSTG